MSKPIKTKNNKTCKLRCSSHKCMFKDHGDQICEAIRKNGSTDDQSICYISQLCESFYHVLDSDGRSALHTAALVGKNKVVHFLLAYGADINFQDGVLQSAPLHFAVMSGNIDTALILLKYGADAKITDKHGFTPAYYIINQQPEKCLSPYKPPVLQGYSWGTNANYNLGLATVHAREFPEHFEVPLKKRTFLSTVSMNKFHSVFLSTHGKVFACGHGRGGRLGFETDSSVIIPQYVKVSKYAIIKISAGVDHTVLLNGNNEVLACGVNRYHQLGFNPPPASLSTPQILSQWHSKFPDVDVIGVAAAAYHTVIWSKSEIFTCGLNAGQLGHTDKHNEIFVDLPRSLPFIKNLDKAKVGEITEVAVSDGATVVSTCLGNVYACYEYKTHHIPLKVGYIEKIACVGGAVDNNVGVDLFSNHKNEELKIATLTSTGDLFIWSDKCTQHVQNGFEIWHIDDIFDFCLNVRELCLVNTRREVFFGVLDEENTATKPVGEKSESNKFRYDFSKWLDYIKSIKIGKKISSLYRTHSVVCDPKGNNFIALQYDPKLFQRRRIGLTSNSLRRDITNHFSRVSESNCNYDVVIVVGHRRFPAHSYILAYNSDYLYEKLLDGMNKGRSAENHFVGEETMEVNVSKVDADVFEELLNFMYTNKNWRFDDPNRFIQFPSEKEDENWRCENFIQLCRKSENEIVEALKKPRNSKEILWKHKWNKRESNLKYPLKPIKEGSCALKMKDLQDMLLLLNKMDTQHEESIPIMRPLDRLYDREKFPEFWDVVFKCKDGEIVKAHKCILMARSSYFEAMLGIRWNQSRETEVVDLSLSSTTLKPLLDFFYTNKSADVSQSKDLDFLCDVLSVAHQYMVEDFHLLCQKSISKCLTLKNAIDVLKFCQAYDANSLKNVILEFICLNMPYYFDTRLLKDLDEETINLISCTYQEVIRPIICKKSLDKETKREDLSDEEKWDSSEENSDEELELFHGFYYIPVESVESSVLSTKTQTTSLPSLEELEIAVKSHPSIVHQTPEDWHQDGIGNRIQPKERRKSGSGSERRRKSSYKKRVRKISSSSHISTSSNSESENAYELEGNAEPFSFEDLEDRVSQQMPNHGDWKVVGKTKNVYTDPEKISEVQTVLQELKIKQCEEETPTVFQNKRGDNKTLTNSDIVSSPFHSASVINPQTGKVGSPLGDNSPFPTLSEALALGATSKGSATQIKRMPKFQSKSGKKSKKSQSNSNEQKSPPSSPQCAWGSGTLENCTPLVDIMRNESSSIISSTPKPSHSKPEKPSTTKHSSDHSGNEKAKDFVATSPVQLKTRGSPEERFHWNPVTNSVIESPKEESGFSFSSIMEEEISYTKHLELERNKPLFLIQLEEKAIRELLEFYGGEYNPEENVTVNRYGISVTKPSWNIQYRHV